MIKKNWKNLLQKRCPKCGCELVLDGSLMKCTLYRVPVENQFDCDFLISVGTYGSLKKKLGNQKYLDGVSQDNGEALNNL